MPLLEAVDPAFDGVALLVRISVEVGRAAAFAAPPQALPDLVGRLGDYCVDPAPSQVTRMAREE
ncbi:hypothetical protein ACH40F_45200 [Streptomyces sp. NPDC020794]|uniref:hypothetical protein n=1 Tax=unclassified Streptomyces TaxID=2593676 RepID=UPI0036E71095